MITDDRRQNEVGLTLVELLVVLAVLALLSTLVSPLVASVVPGHRLNSITNEVIAEVRSARADAIGTGRPVSFDVDINRKTFGRSDQPKKSFGPDLAVNLISARAFMPSDDIGQVRFFPDGTSSGGRLTLTQGTREIVLEIDWFDGSIRRSE